MDPLSPSRLVPGAEPISEMLETVGYFEPDEEDDPDEAEAPLPGSGWVVSEVLLQEPKMLVTVEVPAYPSASRPSSFWYWVTALVVPSP